MSEPALELTMNGEKIIANRHNTAMFTFLGELAVYDHIFVLTDEETNSGAYLFKNQDVWKELAGFLIEHEFPMHLNMDEVAECDRNAFDATMYGDIRSNKSFPQGWVDGKAA